MPMVHPNAAAIDVGATMHTAVRADCAPEPVRSFGSFTADLHRLVDWFTECGVETVVIESTSVYWIPVFEFLDARGFTVFLVDARCQARAGTQDRCQRCAMAQRLHSFGFATRQLSAQRAHCRAASLRASPRASAGVRGLIIQHMQKALTEMNLQLAPLVPEITDATGLRIIRAIIPSERDPEALAYLRHYSCHSSAETIPKALTGIYRA
ncbi:hypothetical protein IVA99_21415 [Bradyrhizobium sp. 162]|nr:hypothetical protein [Bradyrhizobium sp. 162]